MPQYPYPHPGPSPCRSPHPHPYPAPCPFSAAAAPDNREPRRVSQAVRRHQRGLALDAAWQDRRYWERLEQLFVQESRGRERVLSSESIFRIALAEEFEKARQQVRDVGVSGGERGGDGGQPLTHVPVHPTHAPCPRPPPPPLVNACLAPATVMCHEGRLV